MMRQLLPRRFWAPAVAVLLMVGGFSSAQPALRWTDVFSRHQVAVSLESLVQPIGAGIPSEFYSETLGRTLPYFVYLPPGYETGAERYPVLYMLHGLSATNVEWVNYGIFETAKAMMERGEIRPFIIVLPQGDDGYWVDHADGGPQWGQYMTRDMVNEIDSRYRTLRNAQNRAVGGLSMGADGALQLALNFPDVFGIVGANSPVLRPYESAPAYYGTRERFEGLYPVTLVQQEPEVASALRISIDVGTEDIWLANAEAFHEQLRALGIPHEWHQWPGEHNAAYWTEHVPDDLRFYGSAFRP